VLIPPVVSTVREESAEGEVVKFLTRVETRRAEEGEESRARAVAAGTGTGMGRDVSHRFEHLEVESVLIPMIGSTGARTYTLCVSSQVGCAMGCTFCETAQMGLIRSLTTEEIVAQWWNAAHVIGIRPKNIVFMGMGEPLDNYENVVRAIAVLKDHNGPHVPVSNITISTVGRVEGIRRLSEQVKEHGWHRLGIAFSLNAPNDAVRGEIMPINRKWNLAEVQRALLDWPRYSGTKLCIEYVLIPGVNDSRESAREIASFLKPFGNFVSSNSGEQKMLALLNLIPYNPRRNSPWPAPSEEKVDEFLNWLHEDGVFAKRRRTKGRETMAACGQLGAAHIRQRKLVPVTVART
jgi:23S rRNA (adenine2503-C2)-methyltransferase